MSDAYDYESYDAEEGAASFEGEARSGDPSSSQTMLMLLGPVLLDLLETSFQTGAVVAWAFALAHFLLSLSLTMAMISIQVLAAACDLFFFKSLRANFRSSMRDLGVIDDDKRCSLMSQGPPSRVINGARQCGMCSCWWCKVKYPCFIMSDLELALFFIGERRPPF